MDSRIIPPRAAVTTIMPALGGPSSTTFHSSGEKAAFAVIRSSFPIGAKLGTTYARRRNARSRSSPGRSPPTPALGDRCAQVRQAAGLGAEHSGLDLQEGALISRTGRWVWGRAAVCRDSGT